MAVACFCVTLSHYDMTSSKSELESIHLFIFSTQHRAWNVVGGPNVLEKEWQIAWVKEEVGKLTGAFLCRQMGEQLQGKVNMGMDEIYE